MRGALGLIESICCRLPAPLQLGPQGEASGALPIGSPASLLSLLELKFLILTHKEPELPKANMARVLQPESLHIECFATAPAPRDMDGLDKLGGEVRGPLGVYVYLRDV